MPVTWWIAVVAAAWVLAYPQAVSDWLDAAELRLKIWWIDRRMERMARKVYAQLQRDHEAMGLEPLPPFSWKALEDRYWSDD